jgi:ATP-dependent Lon protease
MILGPRRFENEVAMRTSVPGVATGLAWTPVGGDILFVEATRVPGRNKLILTGQLGDVMKESAQAALTLVKARAQDFGVDPGLFEKSDVHIHVPAGAIPKDGPSAGVAMFVALASLLTGRTARNDTAMTGEISLRGLVLPIGGVKEKVLAAARAGITTVLLPARNKKDLEDVPESARKQVRFVWLDRVDDAIAAALVPAGERDDGNAPDQESSPSARQAAQSR